MEPQKPRKAPQNLPKTPSDGELAYARRLIDEAVEPVLRKIVEKLNSSLAPKQIRAGLEINWIFERVEDSPESPQTEKEG